MKYFWICAAAFGLFGVLWLVWQDGQQARTGYLFEMPNAAVEAAYCLAVVERVREITRERGAAALERFVDEQIRYWRGRTKGEMGKGRAALARDSQATGVNEGAHLHVAIQDCGQRAVRLYGAKFSPLDGGG